MDLRSYTVKGFSRLVKENLKTIQDLMRDCSHLSNTDKPLQYIMENVQKANIKDSNKTIVTDFIYANLFNKPPHRFYNGRGYVIELRG